MEVAKIPPEGGQPPTGQAGIRDLHGGTRPSTAWSPSGSGTRASVEPEEYNKFYQDKFYDYEDPQRVITVSAEGAVTYKALLFIPGAHAL